MSITSNPFETLLPRTKPLPAAIHKRVTRAYGELIFHGKRIEDGKLIPILNEAYDEHRNRTGSHIIPFFTKYSEGVLEGMRHDFIPFIDTPDNRKELIINEVTQEICLFPNVKSDDKEEEEAYLSEYMYHYGKQIGKLYKAWCIVCQNPDFFLPSFISLDQTPTSKSTNINGSDSNEKLEDLFIKSEHIDFCINMLMKIEPPAINSNYQFIGKLKGVFAVWYESLLKAGLIKQVDSTDALARLLNNKFLGLNIAARTTSDFSPRAQKFDKDFKVMIADLKA